MDGIDMNKARQEMAELLEYRMPFGKYKGTKLMKLPVDYLVWFKQNGFPAGKLGRYLQIVLEFKG
ncbi:putative quorum-sensing-regulated virulence factor [Fulvivirga sediminis]|uniref:DUF3820 family protein n=2 Tax=Fulvivirga TaxID=396811 RepID=A0A937F7T9_9BACT|nr:DUF3820 family protein [Fulvivirga sediminis]MBL3656617.1 DUF3820 family protein [Fulvivirga sediminis]UII29495.1 DUF3820 family protein [Fulvivirga maritima]